jgi:hypothetical protein
VLITGAARSYDDRLAAWWLAPAVLAISVPLPRPKEPESHPHRVVEPR